MYARLLFINTILCVHLRVLFHTATANQVSERHIRTLTPSAFPEEIVERLECNSTEFDKEWKTKLDAWTEELDH